MADLNLNFNSNLDAFSRLRVSEPESLLNVQCQYDASTGEMEAGATGTGVAPAHSADTRMVAISATAGNGTSFMQSYRYTPYQPGKSHLVFITGVFAAGVAGAVVDVGYFDALNGIILRQNGVSGMQVVRRTSTSGSVVDNVVAQAAWNLDKMDGTGASGITFSEANAFILVIDLQFLGMGRIRMGFDIGGDIVWAHEFLNANIIAVPYMQSATLPVQMLLTATATGATKACYFKCCSVMSEGGLADDFAFTQTTPEAVETAASGARTHLMSIRPKATFNGLPNRITFVLENLEMLVTGNNQVYWELVLGATIAASTWADVNAEYSGFEYTSVRGAFTNLTNGIAIASGYAASTGQSKNSVSRQVSARYPLTLNRAGAVRDLGTLSLLVTGIGGTAPTRAAINFNEIR